MNKLIHGDCLIEMDFIESQSIDMILCDLPYGTTNCKWDSIIPFTPFWVQYSRVIKPNGAIVLTGSQPFTTDLINSNRALFRYEIVWQKTQKMGFLDCNRKPLKEHENILIFYKKQPIYNPQKFKTEKFTNRVRNRAANSAVHYSDFKASSYQETNERFPGSIVKISNWNGALFGNTNKATKHPTQKPVPLFEYLIKTYTNPGMTVLDNCSGSGTTAIACINTGRRYICIEKDENYYNLSKKRIKDHVNENSYLL